MKLPLCNFLCPIIYSFPGPNIFEVIFFIHFSHQPLERILISPLPVSAETALQFYNQNKKQILNIVLPIVQETAEEVITQIGNNILSSAPLSELLPA
jgi:hypothetical protein